MLLSHVWNDLLRCLLMIQPMAKARPWSPDTGLIFFIRRFGVCQWRDWGGGVPALSTDTQSNWIACVVIATPITEPLHSKCVCREDWRGFKRIPLFSFLLFRARHNKRHNNWKLIDTGSALGKQKAWINPVSKFKCIKWLTENCSLMKSNVYEIIIIFCLFVCFVNLHSRRIQN